MPEEAKRPGPARAQVKRDNRGQPSKTVANIMLSLERDRDWQGVLSYNLLRECPVLLKPPPMRVSDFVSEKYPRDWAEEDSTRTAAWLDDVYGLEVSKGQVTEAMMAVARRNQIDPLVEFLDAVPIYDEIERVATFFSSYCGAEDNEYTRGAAIMFFVSAVARARQPGCKVDTMVILEGPQGAKKSSAVEALAGGFFADTPIPIGEKDAYQQIRGKWIYELGELASLKGRDAERIKSFLSSRSDYYRPSYAATARDVVRRCIFVGTTNPDGGGYLTDPTGGRRFWPIKVGAIDLESIRRDAPQLWAEADLMFRAGVAWWPSEELAQLGRSETAERYEGDPWEESVQLWLSNPRITETDTKGFAHVTPLDPKDGVTVSEVLSYAVNVPKERHTKGDQMRISRILKNAGWSRGKLERRNGIAVRAWRKDVTTHANQEVVTEVVTPGGAQLCL
jgi:putative DNA primase/helicase